MFYIVIVDLSISPYKCISFYFVYLNVMWLGEHVYEYYIFFLDYYYLIFFWIVFAWCIFSILLLTFLYGFV